MSRRLSTLLAAVIPAVLLVVLGTTATVPLVAMGPGPTFDTLGVVGGDGGPEGMAADTPVVRVTGRAADPTTGQLDMTTVAVRDHLTLLDAARFWLDPDQTVVPRDSVFPPGRSDEQVDQQNKAEMTGSEDSAEIAAYRYLRLPLGARVSGVSRDGAAWDRLREGDLVLTVDGAPTPASSDVVKAVTGRKSGEQITVGYRRDGRDGTADITLRAGSGTDGRSPDKGYLGVTVGDAPLDGTDVSINLDPTVGGPSAGLMFALGIVDKLSTGELTGGRHVAGTGTISSDGTVGPIGGIRHKIRAARQAGATEFLVPTTNCAEARTDPPAGIALIRVETLDGAITALRTAADGGAPPSCG